jgi:tripartite-type tricarboxylate transporter receptor subunit TctC
MRNVRIVISVLCAALFFTSLVFAQEAYPTKPVQIVVPFAAGGSLDLINRILGEKFREYWGQPVVIANKAGANGAVGMAFVASNKPDGYNIYAAAGASMAYINLTNQSVTRTILDDFTSVGAYANYPLVILANKDLPVKELRELAPYAKKNPKAVSYGTTGHASTAHFTFELFKAASGIVEADMPAIPYAGVAPLLTALLGNQVQVAICPLSVVVAKQIDAGGVRALVITAPKRSPFRPEIPTMVDKGFPDLAIKDYLSYWVPAKTPAAVVKKLEESTRKAIQDKEVREKAEGMYHELEFVSGPEVRKMFEARVKLFGPLIKKLNIKVQ